MTANIELLAPAKNAEIAIEAIKHGADAVYIGAEKFGARASAGNSVDDIARVTDFAHIYNAKVYATVNTIIYDNELKQAENLIKSLYKAGADALIVQDMGILRLDIPPIALHASTQCDTRTVEKAQFLEKAGFSQIVLARELTIDEISEIASNTTAAIECFIHGALCVSYSGRCHASCAFKKRSANRGECAQICRLPYDVYDGNRIVMQNKHILSLRDLNQSENIMQLAETGVSSFKIEGRMKDMDYVKNITSYYNRILNDLCETYPEKYKRASQGRTSVTFEPVPEKSFNRGFTHYFLNRRKPAGTMASLLTPKSTGEEIGSVEKINRLSLTIKTGKNLSNGDGLAYFNGNGELIGFRANKVSGNTVTTLEKLSITKGTTIYRNFDKEFNNSLSKETAERKLLVDIKMSQTPSGMLTEIADETGEAISIHTSLEKAVAKSNQSEAREKVFRKMGGTPFQLNKIEYGDTEGLFIPASILTEIRRNLIDKLLTAKRISYKFKYREKEDKNAAYPYKELTFADNVANRLAAQFYKEHGVEKIEQAMEVSGKSADKVLMATRYCLRRELGCCLKEGNRDKLGKDITIKSGNVCMSVEFDCKNCQMLLRKAKF